MKKNFSLGLIVLVLLGLTYWWIELPEQSEDISKTNSERITHFNFEQLMEFHLPQVKMVKGADGIWKIKDHAQLVDAPFLEKVFIELGYLRIRKEINLESNDIDINRFIDQTIPPIIFYFNLNPESNQDNDTESVSFQFGKKLDYGQDFYLLVKSKQGQRLFVVFDMSDDPYMITDKETSYTDQKYKKYLSLTILEEQLFYNRQIFNRELISTWSFDNIMVDSKRNIAFFLDYKNIETIPSKPTALKYHQGEFAQFLQHLQDLRAVEVVSIDPKDHVLLADLKSEIYFDFKRHWLKLYSKMGPKEGFFVQTSFAKAIFEIGQESAKIFSKNVHHFWLKQAIFLTEDVGLSDVNFSLKVQLSPVIQIKIPTGKEVECEFRNPQKNSFLNQENCKKLLNLLVGNFDLLPGDWHTSYAESLSDNFDLTQEFPDLDKLEKIAIEWNDLKIKIIKNDQEYILYNLTQKYSLHYPISFFPNLISFDANDYFILDSEN